MMSDPNEMAGLSVSAKRAARTGRARLDPTRRTIAFAHAPVLNVCRAF
ncbi:hypothetical protein BURPS305_7852 [Burkholderia pseudomallei 305]|nr:hypothetical protein BURPS305_7852 [Burkholderia pseudomallei 305]EDO90592.1 hypothetical protein BURPSPAST_D0399 [Burkholderia pseudomallei Pasteur 52237]EDS88457.1 hypothetical protein BURPSS13_L0089 [Burkholderia pseudomallei S13]EEP50605.1 conserved hypothetical protein [Burkholderia pseudomallei MSHR346]